jgi:hypothetical protein
MDFSCATTETREISIFRGGNRSILNSGNKRVPVAKKRRWNPNEMEKKTLRFQVPILYHIRVFIIPVYCEKGTNKKTQPSIERLGFLLRHPSQPSTEDLT